MKLHRNVLFMLHRLLVDMPDRHSVQAAVDLRELLQGTPSSEFNLEAISCEVPVKPPMNPNFEVAELYHLAQGLMLLLDVMRKGQEEGSFLTSKQFGFETQDYENLLDKLQELIQNHHPYQFHPVLYLSEIENGALVMCPYGPPGVWAVAQAHVSDGLWSFEMLSVFREDQPHVRMGYEGRTMATANPNDLYEDFWRYYPFAEGHPNTPVTAKIIL